MKQKKLLFGVVSATLGLHLLIATSVYSVKDGEDTTTDSPTERKVVEFQVGSKPDPLSLPPQTPLTDHALDENGIITSKQPNGQRVYNIFEIATQAIEGEKVLSLTKTETNRNLIPRLPKEQMDSKLSNMQVIALNWLEKEGQNLANGLVWYYHFDNAYNDIQVKAPWPSAFGQAHVIKAFLNAYKETGNEKFKQMALKAGYAYDVEIKDGGFKGNLSDGSVFFEEVPTQPATHILNGHMVSTLALLELSNATGDERVKKLAMQGVDTIKKYIHLYDTGYWSRYDLNPKKGEIILRLAFADNNITTNPVLAIDQVRFEDASTGKEVILDVGRKDDFSGAWRISGIDWLGEVDKQGMGRLLIDGRSKHKQPVKGGTTMNTYIIFQLPEWEKKLAELEKPFDIKIKLRYQDLGEKHVKLQIQNINEGNYLEFVDIPGAELHTIGDGNWKYVEFTLPSKHLGWYMGIDYQKYHVQLLKEIGAVTGDTFFTDVANQWETYLKIYESKK